MNPFGLNETMVCVSMSWGPDSDHRPCVQSVSLWLFCPESKAQGHLWLGKSGEGGWRLLSVLVVWFLRTCGWSCHWRSEMKKMRFSCSSDIARLMRGTELQPAASRLSIWLTHRLSSGPGSWDVLCKGLGLPENLPGALPVVTGALSFSHWGSFQCKWSKIYFLDRTGNVVETNKGHTCIHFPSNVT